MTEVALGIDLGTGSTKVAVVTADGRCVAVGRAPHPVEEPRPGWSESAPQDWWDSLRGAATQALDGAGSRLDTVDVAAIGVCGQMHGVVVCEADGTPARPAVLWPDRRATALLAGLADDLGAHLDELGNPLWPGMAGPILAWLVREEPDVVRAAAAALQPKDWLRLRLTGELATDPSDASATLLWDPTGDRWAEQALEVFGVPRRLLPEVAASDTLAGALGGPSAQELGLRGGVPVAVGAGDTPAALLGAGLAAGEPQLSVGTGGQIAVVLERPAPDPSRRTHLYRAVDEDGQPRWYAMAAVQNAGLAVDWALQRLGVDAQDAGSLVGASPVGARGARFLPFLTGERTPHLDPELRAGWHALRRDVTRADLVRSVYEGIAFGLRDALDALRDAGHVVDRLLLAGGGSREEWWRQLLADVLGVPLVPHDVPDASARGAALLGWSAVGRAPTLTRPDPGPQVTPQTDYRGALEDFRGVVAARRG